MAGAVVGMLERGLVGHAEPGGAEPFGGPAWGGFSRDEAGRLAAAVSSCTIRRCFGLFLRVTVV